MVNVLFLARYGHPSDVGGVANAIKNIVKYTSQEGVVFDIFSLRNKNSITDIVQSKDYNSPLIRFTPLIPPKGFGANNNDSFDDALDFLAEKIVTSLRKNKRRIDVIQSFTAYPNYAGLAQKLSEELSVPYIISARGTDVYKHNQEYSYDADIAWYHEPFRNCALVTALSEYLAQEVRTNLKQCAIEDKQVILVHNGVEVDKFKPAEKSFLSEKINAVYTGRIRAFKGIMDIVHSVILARELGVDVELDIYGSSEKGLGDDVLKKIALITTEKGLENVIRCTGEYVSHEDLPKLYAHHNLFLTASRGEGLPNAIMEAMSCGLAVSLNDSSAAKDFELSSDMIFKTGDIGQMAQIINYLSQSPMKLSEEGKRNRQFALRHHWQDIAKQYLGIYTSVTKSN
jgi:glycosyltransferase involved in cell wall biosynthesis